MNKSEMRQRAVLRVLHRLSVDQKTEWVERKELNCIAYSGGIFFAAFRVLESKGLVEIRRRVPYRLGNVYRITEKGVKQVKVEESIEPS